MRTKIAPKKPRFKKHPLTVAVQACCYTLLGGLPLANANPTGGQVVGGSGTISQSGTNTTINQATQNLAINWQTFNIQSNERVQFIQPNASAIALNRILSNNGSTIAGRIDANGKVILVNPNGIFFTSSASLNVGSLIASGLDINPSDFMNGTYVFNEISGTSGTVINQGLINASLGGNVALIGKQVKNEGLIQANLGTVTLAAGKEAVLTFDNDGLLGVRVTKEILQSELGVDPAVINNGEIQAQGGRVLLTASQSQDIFSRAVNNGGLEPATSVVVNDDGTFTLGGGADVLNTGTIDTSTTSSNQNAGRIVLIGENVISSGTLRADAAAGNGGEIELHARDMTLLTGNSLTSARSESNGNGGIVKVLGDKVGLFDQSTVDVSGSNGGGQALIGGDFQGKNVAMPNATVTIVDRDARIFADALQNGDGGKVILWADDTTRFLGSIFTRGGAYSGNGGFVETSGKNYLLFDGTADRTAANGQSGLLLLDPDRIYITSDTVSNTTNVSPIPLNATTGDYTIAFNSNQDASITITPTTLQNALASGDVLLQAEDDINVNSSVTTASTNSLTLEARDDININAPITMGGGNLTLRADIGGGGGDVILYRGIDTNGGDLFVYGDDFDGTSFTESSNIINVSVDTGNDGNATISLTGDARLGGMVVGGNLAVTAGTSAGTGITQGQVNPTNDVLVVTGTSNFISNGTDNDIVLTNSNNLLGVITLTTTGDFEANASITNTAPTTTLGTSSIDGNLTVNATQNLTVTGTIEGRGTDGVNSPRTTTLALNFGTGGSNSTFTATGATIREGASVNNDIVNITITGGNGNNTFNINNATIATINGALSTNRGITIGGGTGSDTFNIATSIDGLISGGAGNDRFNINASGITIFQIDGEGGTSTGGNNTLGSTVTTANDWLVDATDSGSLTNGGSAINFDNVGNLIGSSGIDRFTVSGTGSLAGLLDGSGGASDTLTLERTGVNVGLGNQTVGTTLNVDHVETITSNVAGNIITGPNAATGETNYWIINGTNSGSVSGVASNPLADANVAFSGFDTVTGGDAADYFTISADFAGIINGGDGTDAFNVGGLLGATVNGGDGDDFFNINAGATFTGTANGGAGDDDFLIAGNVPGLLNGDNQDDTFTLDSNGVVSGIINGGGESNGDTLAARQGVGNSWTFTTATSGSLTQVGQASSYVSSFVGIENFGGGGADWADVGNLGTVNIGSYVGFAGLIGSGLASILNGTGGNDEFTVEVIDTTGAPTGIASDGVNDGTVVFAGGTLRFIDFATLNGAAGDDRFVMSASGSVTGAINGGAGINYLTGRDSATDWTINGPNQGNLRETAATTTYVASFTGIQNLIGGAGADTFLFTNNVAAAGASISGAINGGTGAVGVVDHINLAALATVDVTLGAAGPYLNIEQFTGNNSASTLRGENAPNTWTVSGPNDGLVNGITFVNFNNLVGGSEVDDFTINAGSSIGSIDTGNGATNTVTVNPANTTNIVAGIVIGAINGGTGEDTIDVSGSVGVIHANDGDDSLTVRDGGTVTVDINGDGGDDTFTISGTVTGNLNGNAGDDFFAVAGGTVRGTIDGGSHNTAVGSLRDQLDVGANEDVYIGSGIALDGFAIQNIEGVVSSNGRLHARDGYNTTWSLQGEDAGNVIERNTGGAITATLTFSGFSNLYGSDADQSGSGGNDIFNVSATGSLSNNSLPDGSLSGTITAGSGSNSLNINLDPARPAGQVYYIGGSGSDTVSIDGVGVLNTVAYSSGLGFNVNTYDRLAYTGTNTFNVNYTSASVDTVTDRVAATTLIVNGTSGIDTFTLGDASFTLNGQRTVSFTNVNKTNLVFGDSANNQANPTDTINIVGAFSTAANNVTLRNAAVLTQASGTSLSADELVIDRITTLPTQLDTAITSLSATNSGPLIINQTGNLALNQITASGGLTITASGDITDTNTAQRTISGPLTLTATGDILLDEAGFNYLTGPIALDGATVNIDNNTTTNFASVTATTSLTVTSNGDITQSPISAITASVAEFIATGRSVTLNNIGNDFNDLTITADAVSVTDLSVAGGPSIASGLITANSVELTTANGVGRADPFDTSINNKTVFIPDGSFSTRTSLLKISNTAGGVFVTNDREVTVSITNSGDIGIINTGDLIVDRLYTNNSSLYDVPGSKVYVDVSNGKILAYSGDPAYTGLTALPAITEPNIVAAELFMRADQGAGLLGRPDQLGGPVSVSVSDSFTYFFGARSYIYYFVEPPFIFGTGDLVASASFDFLPNLQLLEVESLEEFDPAIFTEIRNYYYEDVAIMMPADQRLDGTDDEKEEEKEQKL